MPTLADIRTTVQAKLAEGGGTLATPTSAQVDAQINSVIGYYAKRSWWFSEATETGLTVVGDPLLPIPTDFGSFLEPNGVVIQQNNVRYPILKITPLQYDSLYVGGTGMPRYYCYRDGMLELYFPPNQNYIYYIHYRKTYADLVDDTDENDFTNYATRLIEYHTLADCYRDYRSEPDMAAIYDAKVKTEFDNVQRQSNERLATGNLTTENITGRSRATIYER